MRHASIIPVPSWRLLIEDCSRFSHGLELFFPDHADAAFSFSFFNSDFRCCGTAPFTGFWVPQEPALLLYEKRFSSHADNGSRECSAVPSSAHALQLSQHPVTALPLYTTTKRRFRPGSRSSFACISWPNTPIWEPVPVCPTLIAAKSV